jgi:two-component system, response regulator YesN
MYHVLVVDDEPAVYEYLSLTINWADYGFKTADAAYDGEEALRKMDENNYDLIITDIRMPGMSGLELLKEIKNRNPKIKMLILSGYGEFNYATEAIQYGVKGYLLKPVDRLELAGSLQEVKAELDREYKNEANNIKRQIIAKDRFVYDLVCGILPENDIKGGAVEFGFVISHDKYVVALCEIQGFYDLMAVNVDEARSVRKNIRDLIENKLMGEYSGNIYEDIDGMLGMILYADSDGLWQEKIEHLLGSICDIAARELDINLLIGYGKLVDSVKNLSGSRKNALSALERKFITTGARVVSYEQVIIEENSLWHIDWDSRQLFDALECSDLVQVRKQIEGFTGKLGEKSLPKDGISSLVFSIVFGVCTLIKQSGGTPEHIFNYSEIKIILTNFFTIEKLNDWMFSKCEQTVKYITSLARDEKMSKIIAEVKKYIDKNYHKNISVKELSQIFYMNSGYLGQLFKKAMSENISDYVNKKKIAEVKKMAAFGNMPIRTILESVGYRNPGYFYKKFREYEGISFAEFNSRHGVKEDGRVE